MPQPLQAFLVEDSRLIRETLIAALEEMAEVNVIGWSDGEQSAVVALKALAQPVDLVLIDLMLAEGSGLGVLRHAAGAGGAAGGARCVVLTNYATPDMRRDCLRAGADRVFDKSNEIDGLIDYCLALAEGRPPPPSPNPR